MFVSPIFKPPSHPGFVSVSAISSPKSYNHLMSMITASEFDGPVGVKGVVEDEGYCTLHLDFGMTVSVAPNGAVLLINSACDSKIAVSACGSQAAILHPQGRVFKYGSRIEVQTVLNRCIRNAKIWPRGISFTSNQSALVYLVDQAGARSTTDTFRDLYAVDITQAVFEVSAANNKEPSSQLLRKCISGLQNCGFWTGPQHTNHWSLFDVNISQTEDGMVSIERSNNKEKISMRSSPNSGKVRLQDNFFYSTASLGTEPHIFVKSKERRLHHNGEVFVVRNGGHSAGIDALGKLNIY